MGAHDTVTEFEAVRGETVPIGFVSVAPDTAAAVTPAFYLGLGASPRLSPALTYTLGGGIVYSASPQDMLTVTIPRAATAGLETKTYTGELWDLATDAVIARVRLRFAGPVRSLP